MKKIDSIFAVLALTLYGSFVYAYIEPVGNKPSWQAQIFIANQIKGIGLVDSYQEDYSDLSYVYDNALAAMASMATGSYGLAKEILDTLCNEVENSVSNVPFESYLYSDTSGRSGSGVSYAGNSAWLLQALNMYQRLTASKVYYSVQKKLADFLLSLQDLGGGLRGSPYDLWKSTEHNIIAYAALRNFGRLNHLYGYVYRAEKIKRFLVGPGIWNGKYFNRGENDLAKVIDVQALGVLLLGEKYSNALTWSENNLRLSMHYNSQVLTGFDFNDDLDTIWLEGTFQTVLAFYKSQNISKGDFYYNEAVKTQQDDGSLILATNKGTASDGWILQPWRAIAPTSWLIFCYLKFSPLILY